MVWTTRSYVLSTALLGILGLAMAATAAMAASARPTQPAGVFSGSTSVTAIELIVRATDAHGHPLGTLAPDDIKILEDGKPVSQISISPLVVTAAAAPAPTAPPTPKTPVSTSTTTPVPQRSPAIVTIFFQNDLLDRAQMSWAIKGLVADAGKLTSLGTVRIVVADPAPHVVAGGITSPETLVTALENVEHAYPARNQITRLRRDFYRDIRGVNAQMVRHLAEVSARQEEALLRRTIERLQGWAAAQPGRPGRILVLVSGGFDLDPYSYYASYVAWGDQADLKARFEGHTEQDVGEQVSIGSFFEQVSQELAGSGWTVLAFTGGMGETDTTAGADVSGTNRAAGFMGAVPQGMTPNAGTMLLHPIDPLREAARASGGAVAVTPDALTQTLAGFTKAYIVSYTVPRPPDGKAHRVTITPAKPGIVIHAPQIVRSVTRDAMNRSRALSLLDGERMHPELKVSATITNVSGSRRKGYRGRLIVKTNMAAFVRLFVEAGTPRTQATVAIDLGKDAVPFVYQGTPLPLRLADRKGDWVLEQPIAWPATATTMAVVVDEVTTDIWGGVVIPLPRPR